MEIFTLLKKYEIEGYYEASRFIANFATRNGAEKHRDQFIRNQKITDIRSRKRSQRYWELDISFIEENPEPIDEFPKPHYMGNYLPSGEKKLYDKDHQIRIALWREAKKPFMDAVFEHRKRRYEFIDTQMTINSDWSQVSEKEIEDQKTDLVFEIEKNLLGD